MKGDKKTKKWTIYKIGLHKKKRRQDWDGKLWQSLVVHIMLFLNVQSYNTIPIWYLHCEVVHFSKTLAPTQIQNVQNGYFYVLNLNVGENICIIFNRQ